MSDQFHSTKKSVGKECIHGCSRAAVWAISPEWDIFSHLLLAYHKDCAAVVPLKVWRKGMSFLESMQANLATLRDMAREASVTIDKAVQMADIMARREASINASRRSAPEERRIIETELPKLGEDKLQILTPREIAQVLADKGLPIRCGVQGVLARISRTRKQLLLTHQAHAAE